MSQALFRLSGTRFGFLPRPLVVQKRNGHLNEADFAAEIPLYTMSEALIEYLDEWTKKQEEQEKATDPNGDLPN